VVPAATRERKAPSLKCMSLRRNRLPPRMAAAGDAARRARLTRYFAWGCFRIFFVGR
jgi:hypothetical protein